MLFYCTILYDCICFADNILLHHRASAAFCTPCLSCNEVPLENQQPNFKLSFIKRWWWGGRAVNDCCKTCRRIWSNLVGHCRFTCLHQLPRSLEHQMDVLLQLRKSQLFAMIALPQCVWAGEKHRPEIFAPFAWQIHASDSAKFGCYSCSFRWLYQYENDKILNYNV